MDIKDCEQAKSGDCCYCKNMEYHKLEQQFQLEKDNVVELNELLISYKEENKKLKEIINEIKFQAEIFDKTTMMDGLPYEYIKRIIEE